MNLDFRRKAYLILALIGIVFYANTLNHDYVLDDFSVIKENFVVKQGLDGIPTIFKTHYRYGYGYQNANLYRPLTLSLFALQWEIAPDSPAFAHAFNILLYALLLVLLAYFLNMLWKGEHFWLSFLSVLFFALHPIHTEVVANIKSQDEILAMSLSILSLILYYKATEEKSLMKKALSLLLFGLAMFSKESSIVFLAILPLSLILFRSNKIGEAIRKSIPYLAPTFIYLIARINVLGSLSGDKSIAKIDNILVSAPNEAIKLASAIKIMGLYIWKLIFPHPLMNDYSYQQITLSSWSDPWVYFSLGLYLALFYALYYYWKREPKIAFAISFYLIGMALYSNIFITIGTAFGERLLFIPSLGFCIVLAYLIISFFQKELQLPQFWLSAKKVWLVSIPILLLYGFKTVDRNKAWEDNFTLYSTDVEHCSRSARCQYYYGLGLMKEKALNTNNQAERENYLNQCIESFSRAIEIYPGYSDAYGERGLAYYRLKNYAAAEKDYLKSVEFNPSNANSLSNLGTLYFEQKMYQQARQVLFRAVQANPTHVDALGNLGSTLGTLGEYQLAIKYFKQAIALKPNVASYHQMVGITYQNMGKPQLAQPYLQKAAALSN